jgi:MFS family permease
MLTINWNPFSETWRNLALAATDRTILVGLVGISWLWFIGAIFLTSFFSFARDVLLAGPTVVTLLLAVFTVGIGLGSLVCGRASTTKRGLGLVPLGGVGMTIFAVDLYLGSHGLADAMQNLHPNALYTIGSFLHQAQHWRLLIDLFLLAFAGGLYSVPLYAMVQARSVATHRARIIAANNILNALFMVGASVLAMVLGAFGASIPTLYLLVGLLNAIVVVALCWRAPDIARQSYGLLREYTRTRKAAP